MARKKKFIPKLIKIYNRYGHKNYLLHIEENKFEFIIEPNCYISYSYNEILKTDDKEIIDAYSIDPDGGPYMCAGISICKELENYIIDKILIINSNIENTSEIFIQTIQK